VLYILYVNPCCELKWVTLFGAGLGKNVLHAAVGYHHRGMDISLSSSLSLLLTLAASWQMSLAWRNWMSRQRLQPNNDSWEMRCNFYKWIIMLSALLFWCFPAMFVRNLAFFACFTIIFSWRMMSHNLQWLWLCRRLQRWSITAVLQTTQLYCCLVR